MTGTAISAAEQERFRAVRDRVLAGQRVKGGIGTLGEKTLHAVLKRYIEPWETNHETKIGPYVADIVGEDGIVEIQTRSFDRLRNKLAAFLEVANVTVVYPMAAVKWLSWIDPATGEVSKRRRSPKRGSYYDAFFELYRIKHLLPNPNLRLRLMLLDLEEYRNLDGWGKHAKYRATRHERIPLALAEELMIAGPEDYIRFLPEDLPERFTTRDFQECAGVRAETARLVLHILHHIGTVRRVGKEGRRYLYERGPEPRGA